MAQAPGAGGAAAARRLLQRSAPAAGAARRAIERPHAMGRVHRERRHPPLLAAGAPGSRARRLCGGARSGAPGRAQPFAPLLGPAGSPVSRLARGARAPRARRPYPAHPERNTMRLLHTMLRVGDLQRSVKFYTGVLGMKLLRTTDRPEQKYSLAFVGYDDEKRTAVLELTYNYGVERYELGTAFGPVAIGVPDVRQAGDKGRTKGGRVQPRPLPANGATRPT